MNKKRVGAWLVGVTVLVGILTPSLTQAGVIVNWGGDYTAVANANMLRTWSDVGGGVWKLPFDLVNPLNPTVNYVAPAGKSSTFYGGGWSDGRAVSIRRVGDLPAGDVLFFQQNNNTVNQSLNAALVFKSTDFLGDPASQYAFNGDSAMSMNIVLANKTTHRFLVQNGSQWYMSSAAFSTVGSASLSGSALLNSSWGLWNPTNGTGGVLGGVPTEFSTLGSTFSDIKAVGYFVAAPVSINAMGSQISSFTVTAIPEPATVGLFMVSGAGLMLVRRVLYTN